MWAENKVIGSLFIVVFMAYTVEPGYNDTGLYDTSPIETDILWYQLLRHC
jgi:hypothetical protein